MNVLVLVTGAMQQRAGRQTSKTIVELADLGAAGDLNTVPAATEQITAR